MNGESNQTRTQTAPHASRLPALDSPSSADLLRGGEEVKKMADMKAEQELAGHFEYLDDLRDSGVTNMFGAAVYLRRDCGLDKATASKGLSQWMRTFSKDKTAEQRAAEALAQAVS